MNSLTMCLRSRWLLLGAALWFNNACYALSIDATLAEGLAMPNQHDTATAQTLPNKSLLWLQYISTLEDTVKQPKPGPFVPTVQEELAARLAQYEGLKGMTAPPEGYAKGSYEARLLAWGATPYLKDYLYTLYCYQHSPDWTSWPDSALKPFTAELLRSQKIKAEQLPHPYLLSYFSALDLPNPFRLQPGHQRLTVNYRELAHYVLTRFLNEKPETLVDNLSFK